jgi:murein L,D-transpeptidase YcbB/YkuD
MEMSARVLRYARDVHNGRVDPNKLSGYHDLPVKEYDLVAVLEELSKSGDVRDFLEAQHPQMPEYQALRDDLEALRASPEQDIVVNPDMFVRPGGSDPDFPKILEIIKRDGSSEILGQYGDLIAQHADSDVYGKELAPLIKAVQEARDLHPDGVIGPRTVKALAGESKASRILKDELALERLRWHPSKFGNPHVLINTAAFTAAFNQDGKNKLLMRVVVGKKTNQTSYFYDEIEYVQFNPYWGVPRSIIINEMLPRLLRDPGYLDRAGYEVTDSKGRHIPSAAIDWSRIGPNIPYDIRQVPSEQNALGELKIMFPNKHAIYMHDTPQKSLFKRDVRAFSHGCVRLQEPREMAAAVLGWPMDQVVERLGQGHNQAKLDKKIPVYVAYFTAWPDDTGKVSYYNDIYDRDSHLQTALEKVEAARQPSLKMADGTD